MITGVLRDVRWDLPTLHAKWEAEPGDPSLLDLLVCIIMRDGSGAGHSRSYHAFHNKNLKCKHELAVLQTEKQHYPHYG